MFVGKKETRERERERGRGEAERKIVHSTIVIGRAIDIFTLRPPGDSSIPVTHLPTPSLYPSRYRRLPAKVSLLDKGRRRQPQKKARQFNVLNLTACCVSLGISYLIFVPYAYDSTGDNLRIGLGGHAFA